MDEHFSGSVIQQLSNFSFEPQTIDELGNIIVKSFSIDNAPGHDNISMKIIHHSLQNMVRPLVSIINLSLSTDVFP